ncbi:hypothetical protein VC83_05319 [Pseudogymnoascus destructans]|uniref:2'-phosphotransferase n=1 Tax=Pseudogymnoascus destructans TaxID=655981 RepID=A0A177A7N1_9PEZI|nr:uncharacterized protein VC83_05319 [Pseudogymnoascus destructans]OAF58139.1 hypothetical protein VC83_05319 [Pseudogymnoascus destructans]
MSPTGEQALADQLQDAPPPQSRKSGAGGGGGGGGGSRSGKGRSGGGGQSRDVQVSKALSKLLRHDAVKAGLELDEEGFAGVGEALQWPRLKSLKVTFADILTAVTDNSKQRFALKLNPRLAPSPSPDSTTPSDWLIRANQGHSITIDSSALLTPITLEADNIPPVVVHGTYYAFYPSIVASGGLKKMSRNHIHFSTGLPEDREGKVVSGMRNDAEVLIYVDVRKSLEEGGTSWWVSDNGVVLSEGDGEGVVGRGVWTRVEGRKREEVGVLWEEGREVAELPREFRDRKGPGGKGPNRGQGDGGKGTGKGRGRGKGKGEGYGEGEGEGKGEGRERGRGR